MSLPRQLPGLGDFVRAGLGVTMSLILAASGVSMAESATWTVAPDGSGDFPTIAAAMAGADEGDIIELTSGLFQGEGNRDLDPAGKNLTLRSASGDPASTTLDAEGSAGAPHQVLLLTSGETNATRIEGLTLRGGFAPTDEGGGAVLIAGAAAVFADCRFEENTTVLKGTGGAVSLRNASSCDFERCVFAANEARQGGALSLLEGSQANLNECEFSGNGAGFDGGAIFCFDSTMMIDGSTFQDNEAAFGGALFLDNDSEVDVGTSLFSDNAASTVGGAVAVTTSAARIEASTLAANRASAFDFMGGGAAWCSYASTLEISNSIIAFNTFGQAVVGEATSEIALTCTTVHGNEGGDWTGEIADQEDQAGNLSTNPYFCSLEMRDFTLAANSPCLPELNTCGVLMGAEESGCGAVPVRNRTWGRIKSDYREWSRDDH